MLFPVRMALATLFFLLMWPIALLRSAGLSEEECSRPIRGWRRRVPHVLIWSLSRAVFLAMGFPWIRVKGRRAGLQEAPVLVVAPHSSFLDMVVLMPTQLATVVSRSENLALPVIGGKGLGSGQGLGLGVGLILVWGWVLVLGRVLVWGWVSFWSLFGVAWVLEVWGWVLVWSLFGGWILVGSC